jgi:hypothetical protein
VTAQNTLGEYLRARRELVDPKEVGLRVAQLVGELSLAEPGPATARALSLLAAGAVPAGAVTEDAAPQDAVSSRARGQ